MESEESDCPWLLRSPDTNSFDLLAVSGEQWSIWVGTIIKDSKISVTCNGCKSHTDCNLNGVCFDGQCNCTSASGHYGKHCEHVEPCPRIMGSDFNYTWHVIYRDTCEPVHLYGRSVYTLTHMDAMHKFANNFTTVHDDDLLLLIYSGSRWFGTKLRGGKNWTIDQIEQKGNEYHAFWDYAYYDGTLAVSDPTTGSIPVGVDFYKIGERGQQYGPMGVLYPMQEPPGRGLFRCDISTNFTGDVGHNNFYNSCV